MCKSRAAHRTLIICNMSCATWYKGTAQLLSLTELKFVLALFNWLNHELMTSKCLSLFVLLLAFICKHLNYVRMPFNTSLYHHSQHYIRLMQTLIGSLSGLIGKSSANHRWSAYPYRPLVGISSAADRHIIIGRWSAYHRPLIGISSSAADRHIIGRWSAYHHRPLIDISSAADRHIIIDRWSAYHHRPLTAGVTSSVTFDLISRNTLKQPVF